MNGALVVLGRSGDILNRGGITINAAEIADALNEDPEDYARLGGHMFTRIAGR